jgi:hypothetical protein
VVPDLVPVDLLTEVNNAIAVLEIQGPAIAEALRQLDRATTMAWKAAKLHGVTDEQWELVKRAIGIDHGWGRPTSCSPPSTCLTCSRPST